MKLQLSAKIFRYLERIADISNEHRYLYLFEDISKRYLQLEMWPMPNVMAALRNIGGTLCSTPQSLADAHY